MATIQIEAKISPDQLLSAVKQMPRAQLERFVEDILTLRAQSSVPTLPAVEAELLSSINQGLPELLRQRYDELIVKRRALTLTREEHLELLSLTDQVERWDAERLKHLVELARLRNTSLADVMQQLGIQPPPNV